MQIDCIMSLSRILIDLCVIRQKVNDTFGDIVCSILVVKVLMENKGVCLKINDTQSVKIRGGSVKFNNSFKQIAVMFTIFPRFESILKGL